MLVLEIEFLSGVYRASLPDGSMAEWPPHPDRIFSALVQAWGDGARRDDEKRALEWLEALSPPILEAARVAPADMRDAWTVYVPPNDPRGAKLDVMPLHRKRQARVFRALAVPPRASMSARAACVAEGDAVGDVAMDVRESSLPLSLVYVGWEAEAPPEVRESLRALAHRVASLGHSSSLVRFHFLQGRERKDFEPERTWRPDPSGTVALRTAYAGRLRDLERWFAPDGGASVRRPISLSTTRYRFGHEPAEEVKRSVFGGDDDWFVFESASTTADFEPDILGLAHISRRMRDALLNAAGENAPEILSGHSAPSVATARPHVAIVPLLNAGWEHATGDLLGVAVCLPRETSEDDRRIVLQALARFSSAPLDDDAAVMPESPRFGKLQFRHGIWILERSAAPSRHSLRPARYCARSKVWASVTPVQLDRFPERDDPEEEARIIAAACENIDVGTPSRIDIHKHSAIRGAPGTYPSRGVRHRPEWSFPADSKFKNRPRRHVVLYFDHEVQGPVILGAGRYFGFGLCMPFMPSRDGEGVDVRYSWKA